MNSLSDTDNLEILGFYGEGLFSVIPLPTFLIDKQGQILTLNSKAETLLDISAAVIRGTKFVDTITDKKRWEQIVKKIEDNNGQLKNYKLNLKTKENLSATIQANIKQERNADNEVVGYILIGFPVLGEKTGCQIMASRIEEKQGELEATRQAFSNMLAESDESRHRIENEQQRTRATLMSLADGVILIDQDKRVSMVNTQAEEILEVKENEVMGKRFEQLKDFSRIVQLKKVLGQYEHASFAKQPIFGKKEFVLGEHQKKYYQLGITRAISKSYDFGMIIELHDVTQEKAIDRMKSEFISIAAHQLRTPLTGINWSLDAILGGDICDICPESHQLLKQTAKTAKHMTQVVNDLLNVSRLEQNKSVYNFGLISPTEPLKAAVSGLAFRAKTSGIKLNVEIADDLPKVKGDIIKLQMVFYNLIDNAIKYSNKDGNIYVKAIPTIDSSKTKVVQISIKDDGVGIEDDEKERIFTKFFRASNAVKIQTDGSGMGLFIARQIIDGHNGKIWFESKKGQGTTFYVNLPVMEGYVIPQQAE